MKTTASKQRKTYRTEWVDRWSPPKPLVGLPVIERVLNRHTYLVCPESRLVVAVLARAIFEALSPTNRRMRREARRFLLGDDLTLWCDLVGLHPHFVRRIALEAGYFADEKAHWQKVPIKVPVLAQTTDPVIAASQSSVHLSAVDATHLNPFGEPSHA